MKRQQVRPAAVDALLSAARSPSTPMPTDVTVEEIDAALDAVYAALRGEAAAARTVTEVASRWQTTRMTRRRVNAAMPSIVDRVHEQQHEVARLQEAREARTRERPPPRWRRLLRR